MLMDSEFKQSPGPNRATYAARAGGGKM